MHFDYIWALFFITLMFLAYVSWGGYQKTSTKWAICITFIFVAFRAPVVGADTWDYVRYLTGEKYFYNLDARALESSFVSYRAILSSITSSRFVVMLVNTLISMGPVFYLYKKYSLNVALSFLLFFYMGAQHLYFIGLRQIIGNSFILWALIYYLHVEEGCFKFKVPKNSNSQIMLSEYHLNGKGEYPWIKIPPIKLLKCIAALLCSIIIGYGFHTTCIVYGVIIFLLLFVPLKSKLVGYAIIISSLAIGLVLEHSGAIAIFNSIVYMQIGSIDRISVYFERAIEKDAYAWNVIIRLSVIGIITLYFMSKEKVNHIFTKLFVFGIAIYNLLYSSFIIERFIPAFTLFGFICFTWIFDRGYKDIRKRNLVNIVTLLFVLYLTRSAFIELNSWNPSSGAKMHPYYFFFQNYSDHPSIKY